MISIILRCSNRAASRRALSAASVSVETLVHHLSSVSNGETIIRSTSGIASLGAGFGREFHCKSAPLNFRASLVPRAEYAVDDYSPAYEEEKGNKDDGLEIAKLGISEEIVSALSRRGINKLFPIQRAVLEPAMQGRDMIGRAKTGTGKTLAFGIPIIDKIIQFNAKHGRGRNPLSLVLAPTRELAKQVEKEFRESAPSLDAICVYGGTPIGQQMRQLDYGVDIVVGTPGRIIDLLKRGALNLAEVQFLVLDEADQMLQVGFADDVETILEKLPQNRQSMMFSATMPHWIKSLTQKYLKNPLTIDLVGDSNQKLAEGISLFSIESDMYGKASVVGTLVTEHAKGGKCIVFTQTKRDADRLSYAMAKNYRCEALHGDISQSQRERTLTGFRDGHFNILVATDVAARGLDIPNVDLIIHYELPNTSETFVHRTGRTGRAGKKGTAILIYTQDQIRNVRLIEREVGCRFNQLPRIAVDSGSRDFIDMGAGGRFGSSTDRKYGDTGFGRFGGRGEFGFGRSGADRNPGFGRSGSGGRFSEEFGGNRGSSFGWPNSNANRSGGFGGRSDRESGRSDRSNSGFGSARGGFGQNSGLGGFGSGRSTGFGDTDRSRAGGFGNSGLNRRSESFGEFPFGNQ